MPGPIRSAGLFALRYLARVAFAIWFGGFTFYAAVVVPDLHETFGGMETGEISRRVSVILNAIGVAAVALGWAVVALDRDTRSGWRGKARLGLLTLSSLLLFALIGLHRELGARLDSGAGHRAFFRLHEFYLILSTAQWFANLGLIAVDSAPSRTIPGDSRITDARLGR